MEIANHQKAEILARALPYIQMYRKKVIVVKYGGNAMINEELKETVMNDLVLLSTIGIHVVLVHGGGPEINKTLERMHMDSQFVDGLRVTDKETAEVVQMVLAGKVNKSLVCQIGNLGGHAIGLCGLDGNMLKCKPVDDVHGYVGEITEINMEIVEEAISKNFIPVISTIGYDENGLHFIFNPAGNKTVDDLGLSASGTAIIKGAQGATGTATIATFTAGFILVMITLIVVLNLTRSRAGRAIMAIRDNRIAAQAIGLNLTKYKLMAFVTSAALAGAAGALYGLNYSSLQATKFNFNLSILVLVFVVLGGLGNIWGSLVAAAALTILPEALRQFADFRMLIYAIVLIFVMLATNNPQAKAFFQRLLPHRRTSAEKED